MDNTRIAIYGAGSLGTILGAYLTRAGLKVDLVNRNRSHIEALRQNGAHVVGKVDFVVPVSALFPEEMTERYDVIFLMTKQLDNRNVVAMLKDHLTDTGIICTCQNGLPELGIASIIGEDRTYGCTIGWGATLLGNGVSELTSEPDALTFDLGRLKGGEDVNLRLLKQILSNMGPAEIDSNFIGARWTKLLINATFSGMSAVTGETFGKVAEEKSSREICQRLMKECFDTAHKDWIKFVPIQGKNIEKIYDYNTKLKKKIAFALIPLAMKKHKDLKASMLQDLEKGKRCEVEAINGVVCEYGRKVGVATPCNDKVVEIIGRIEKGELKPSWSNLELFKGI